MISNSIIGLKKRIIMIQIFQETGFLYQDIFFVLSCYIYPLFGGGSQMLGQTTSVANKCNIFLEKKLNLWYPGYKLSVANFSRYKLTQYNILVQPSMVMHWNTVNMANKILSKLVIP